MSTIKTGGSAFPNTGEHYIQNGGEPGLTLRDYFAAKGMVGMLSSPDLKTEIQNNPKSIALLAYRFADAMIAEREKTEAS